MSYSIDLRQRVMNYIQSGGSKTQACRLFQVGRTTIYRWLQREDLRPTRTVRRHRKLDWDALKRHVQTYPDALLKERAAHFGVHINAIWYALKCMKIRYKKNAPVPRKKPS
ncbi:MAG: helix-turn-helix domain-containing protein, partial [Aliifodinibius sp.]|nr:helix-turn-helix domain-containing protein [Fodinibius sp.]NIV14075.1 helix-turn-helix domain-containing protein [Fodinibius sp.]NIY27885.1 helix-turn-helix domain-containing protein [Fodinibius sp.]